MGMYVNESLRFVYVITFAFFILSGCKKNGVRTIQEINDAQYFRLKEVAIHGEQSPYLHLTYNTEMYITEMSVEYGSFLYIPEYRNGRLYKIVNKAFAENDTLFYFYSGNQVSRIDWVTPGNGKRHETLFTYDMFGRLITASWRKNSQSDFFKTMKFYYNQQGNMNRCDIFSNTGFGQIKTGMYLFEDFDDKENVLSNELLKEYHLLILPRIRLQKNNPLRVAFFGINEDFIFQNSYQYSGFLPVNKVQKCSTIRGSGAGNSMTTVTNFTYY